ncbi:transposase [Streptomyces nigrescens]|uniref:Transposase n=1 Tax=Streptomyces nigrescens TaxID=1920 RepID=A0ABY7JG55_STRNI|nr:transposase [Streptomyces nigrescens]WAU09528.1 transposase [Streptomyces nigrescens]
MRADSQFYNAGVIAACRRARARRPSPAAGNRRSNGPFTASPTPHGSRSRRARPRHRRAHLRAEGAEIPAYTAFASRKKNERVTARLIVRRVRDLAKPAVMGEQGELFPVWRHGPFFTDTPAPTLQAEREHRHHAVVEQVIADSKASALAHVPSAHFNANAAWLTLWAMAYSLLRAAGSLTSAFHAKPTTATLRAHLIHVPARIARSARRITVCLPHNWRWQHAWTHLFETVHGPPAPA